MSSIFLDTNILVYAYDTSQPAKQTRAQTIIASFQGGSNSAVASTQVLQEFYYTLTGKLKIARPDAFDELRTLLNLQIVQVTPAIIISAAELHDKASISFWDALIVAAAQFAGCQELWTEDMQNGRQFGSLMIVNPL